MVSLQAARPLEEKKRPCPKVENLLSKKRKNKNDGEEEEERLTKEMKSGKKEEIELNLDAPLPMDWQQCLDIKSGRIHFYNTKTHRRTSTDPRLGLDPPLRSALSLDLELNLACREPPPIRVSALLQEKAKTDHACSKSPCDGEGTPLSWVSPVSDAQEMVAAVCARCHMLVMMSKAALSCPNCKFVNRPERLFSTEIKSTVNFLCCKDL
ncbi:hypothetical protein ZIOFF_057599 [Zingiber officinale]|uniref:WW domain-containing protein n=2 Tax=Zingiber officinale TaxID=94328 RepID=A0A8J5KL55_ZINOF|nr:hypothetical protein ZIOFF_057599 [Zingiber officinale]